MEPGEYDGLKLKASKNNDFQSQKELLEFIRLHKVHQPEIVIKHGGDLLNKYERKLGSECWTVMEQVFLAACTIGHDGWRDYCIERLKKQWANKQEDGKIKSYRVERLKGICEESKGDWEKARKTYEGILKDKPEDTIARKRLIAIYKERGEIEKAIAEIVGQGSEGGNRKEGYLDTFSTDAEAWHELAELYLEVGSLERARYCFEELLLSNPRSLFHILTYAELLYSTAKEIKEFEDCRRYFSLATYLDDTCLRALWGLWAVSMKLQEQDKEFSGKHKQLLDKCSEKLRNAYSAKGKGQEHCQVTKDMLKSAEAAAPQNS